MMYIPKHFAVTDEEKMLRFIEDIGFGMLISSAEGDLHISHLPFYLDKVNRVLFGHFARANVHWQMLRSSSDHCVVFNGPHTYISPSWYVSERQVPTWNFTTVHVSGRIAILENDAEAIDVLNKLSNKNETAFPLPWRLDKLPSEQLQAMLKGIVGFRIDITKLEGKFKLNQNRRPEDRQSVITHLEDAGSDQLGEMAAMMKDIYGDAS